MGLFNKYSGSQLTPFISAKQLELISVEPEPPAAIVADDTERDSSQPASVLCHGYPILGRVMLTSAPDLEAVRSAIQDLNEAGKSWEGNIAACFNPRHCIRLTTKAGTFDLLICYECSWVKIFKGEATVGKIYMNGRAAPRPDLLNAILHKHAIPFPEAPLH